VIRNILFLVVTALMTGPPAAHAGPKTDKVKLLNGDLVTGEIKQLQRGQLRYSTDDIGTVYIEWGAVLRITSPKHYRVRLRSGAVITGRLLDSGIDRVMQVAGVDSLVVSSEDVVEIAPIETSFWVGLDGSFSLGASYTKASEVGQLSFDSSTYYQTVRNRWQLLVSSITTVENQDTPANTQNLSFALDRDLTRKSWFLGAGAGAQRNDELGLDLRVLLTLTAGIRPVESNHNVLAARTGLSLNREYSADSTDATTNVEAVFTVNYSLFRYNSPKSDITSSLSVFPNLTTWGRVRLQFDTSAKHEVFSDFFLSVSVYDSYDSDPPVEATGHNDYGFVTSVGWSY